MTGTFTDSSGAPAPAGPRRTGRRITWRERAFVLGGLGLAALYTAASLALDTGTEAVGPLWMAAIAWTVVAAIAHVLWLGLAHGDRSAFHAYEPSEDDGELDEWSSHTGRYSWLGDMEDRLHDDDHLR